MISCLTGAAVTWWCCSKEREQIYTWKDFQDKLKTRFRPSRGSSAVDHLLNIRQTSTVDEYRDRFEELTVELPHVTTDILESAFLNGLRRNLKDQVVRYRPVNLTDIVEIARLIESQERDNLSYQVRAQPRPVVTASQVPSVPRGNDRAQSKRPFELSRDTNRASSSGASGSGEARNTNPCRNCGDKWFPGHRCKPQKLKSRAVTEEEEQEGPSGEELGDNNDTDDHHQGEEEGFVTLTLGSMTDMTRENSMKLRGYIGCANVVLLVDSGATSNFIDERLVHQMGWPVIETRGFGVRVGGGRVIRSRGKCVNVPLEIQGIEIMEDSLLFDLGDLDVVLGFSWLAKLGDTRTNWGWLRLSWQIGYTWVTLYGDPELCREQVTFHAIEKIIKYTGDAYLLELASLFDNKEQLEQRQVPPTIQHVFDQFQKVFQMPQSLPPTRNREHVITLQEGTTPINLRPYRYSYGQKDEI